MHPLAGSRQHDYSSVEAIDKTFRDPATSAGDGDGPDLNCFVVIVCRRLLLTPLCGKMCLFCMCVCVCASWSERQREKQSKHLVAEENALLLVVFVAIFPSARR